MYEASQLARLMGRRLGYPPRAAHDRRAELLLAHLAVQGSQTRLRIRVRELLGESAGPTSQAGSDRPCL